MGSSRRFIGPALFLAVFGSLAFFVLALRPVRGEETDAAVLFEVKRGDSFLIIGSNLRAQGLIRSKAAFGLFTLLSGSATRLKAGTYSLAANESTPGIVRALSAGSHPEATVTITEGMTIYQIDEALAGARVLPKGALLARSEAGPPLEGRLFPDTYTFFLEGGVDDVLEKFSRNFEAKTGALLGSEGARSTSTLIMASIVEKEVPDFHDRRVVAGILKKRLVAGMPLQVDATICYAKQIQKKAPVPCYPLIGLDFAMDSPYNTYKNRGLPPGPIASPSVDAITAVIESAASPYWYYLSDPVTKKTLFSVTLDEQTRNKVKYLR